MVTIMPAKNKKRYVVAMSGGVDSSVAAALMVEQGHEVIGITLQLTPATRQTKIGSCCAGADIDDARRVAHHLAIPHYVLNFEEHFRKSVIDDFVQNYMEGKTPVPCVRCNQTVKFRDLLAIGKNLGAERLVTGHYVRMVDNQLHRAKDGARDQSYFLFATTQDQLASLLFPLGDMTKQQVRAHARRLRLPTAHKAESRDLCFVSKGHYSDVIRRLHPNAGHSGDIRHVDGTWLGRHHGIEQFTVGQRRGLNIGGRYHTNQDKLYVIAINSKTHEVTVGSKEALARRTITVHDVHWLTHTQPSLVQWRSPQQPAPAHVTKINDDTAQVTLHEHNHGIAPGQACVFYHHDQLLGGGWIRNTAS